MIHRADADAPALPATEATGPAAEHDPDLGRRALHFILWMAALPLLVVAACLLVPPGVIPEEFGIAASVLACGAVLWIAALLLRRYRIPFPLRLRTVVLLVLLKLGVGLAYWHVYLYDLETGRPRIDFVLNEIYNERRADVECILQLIRIFDRSGVHYVTPAEAEITINNRPPAHVAAIIVRAFGEQVPAFFSFNSLAVTLGALAITVACMALGLRGRRLRAAAFLSLLWPYSWLVATPSKDLMLFAFVAITAALLIVAEHVRARFPWGVLYAFCVLPFFRPVYAVIAAALGTSLLLRRRVSLLVKVFGLLLVVTLGIGLAVMLSVESNIEQHTRWAPNETRLLAIPILGKVIFGMATPFPWTQIFDGWWKYTMVYLFAQQVITLATFWCIVQAEGVRVIRRAPDLGVLLGASLVVAGLLVPNTQALYVHVGVIAMLPFALIEARKSFGFYVKRSLLAFVAGNALWLLIR